MSTRLEPAAPGGPDRPPGALFLQSLFPFSCARRGRAPLSSARRGSLRFLSLPTRITRGLSRSARLAFFLVLLSCGSSPLFAAESTGDPALDAALEDFKISLWEKDIGLSGGFGYKDNVLLSNNRREGSPFGQAALDAMIFRLPTHGWLLNLYLNAEHTQYFDSESVDNEQFALGAAQLSKLLGKGWKTGVGLNYLYQDQVYDISATETNRSAIGQIKGHTLVERWNVRKDFQQYWAELELSATRQWLARPLDDFWQIGPKLTLARALPRGSEVSFSYQWSRVDYDSREQVNAAGLPQPGTELEFYPHAFELGWRHHWDEQKRWQTTSRLGFELNQDNGSGFFDYYYYRFAQQIKYQAPTWELSAGARIGYYDYPVQPVAYNDSTKRRRTVLTFSLHAEKSLTKKARLFLNYSHDRSESNLQFDDYHANTVMAGLEYKF